MSACVGVCIREKERGESVCVSETDLYMYIFFPIDEDAQPLMPV